MFLFCGSRSYKIKMLLERADSVVRITDPLWKDRIFKQIEMCSGVSGFWLTAFEWYRCGPSTRR